MKYQNNNTMTAGTFLILVEKRKIHLNTSLLVSTRRGFYLAKIKVSVGNNEKTFISDVQINDRSEYIKNMGVSENQDIEIFNLISDDVIPDIVDWLSEIE
jgi:hypothetical protein